MVIFNSFLLNYQRVNPNVLGQIHIFPACLVKLSGRFTVEGSRPAMAAGMQMGWRSEWTLWLNDEPSGYVKIAIENGLL